jgi:hypothetical protein
VDESYVIEEELVWRAVVFFELLDHAGDGLGGVFRGLLEQILDLSFESFLVHFGTCPKGVHELIHSDATRPEQVRHCQRSELLNTQEATAEKGVAYSYLDASAWAPEKANKIGRLRLRRNGLGPGFFHSICRRIALAAATASAFGVK